MKYFLLFLLIVCSFSCEKKIEESKPIIEVYQLNKRIVSYEGKAFNFSLEKIRYDTIFYEKTKNIARTTDYANLLINGDFIAKTEDLNAGPLISHDLIKGFDFTTDELILDGRACEIFTNVAKIKCNFPDIQLVLTIDKKPILSFYKPRMMSSWDIGRSYFVIECDLKLSDGEHFEPSNPIKRNALQLFKGPMGSNWYKNKLNLKQDTTFYNAFKRAGKIIAQ